MIVLIKFLNPLILSIKKTSEEAEARQREKIKNYWKEEGSTISDAQAAG